MHNTTHTYTYIHAQVVVEGLHTILAQGGAVYIGEDDEAAVRN